MSHPSEQIEGVFGRPFTEQVAFFRRKLKSLVPTRRWDDLEAAEHDDAFMVAGAAKADLLTDLAAATDKFIAEGRGIEEFRRDFRAIVRRNGWTGWTGEGSVKGEAWRVGVIYRTNAYTSYAAGRMAQLREGGFPIWVYRHGGSKEPRIVHLGWDGMYLPADHEFWTVFYPPSDWECSCYVVGARSERGAKRLGGDPDKTLSPDWKHIDPKTGAPIGAGKGWGYAPGASVSDTVNAMARKVGAWDRQIAKAFMDELPADRRDALSDAYRRLPSTADDARRYAQRVYAGTAGGTEDMAPLAPVRTLGMVRSDQARTISDMTDIDVDGYDFTIDTSAVGHGVRDHGHETDKRHRSVDAADFAMLPQILSGGSMRLAGTSDLGEQLIEFSLTVNSETYVARMAVRGRKRGTLALKTMFIRIRGK